jgi:hypothetical protein
VLEDALQRMSWKKDFGQKSHLCTCQKKKESHLAAIKMARPKSVFFEKKKSKILLFLFYLLLQSERRPFVIVSKRCKRVSKNDFASHTNHPTLKFLSFEFDSNYIAMK